MKTVINLQMLLVVVLCCLFLIPSSEAQILNYTEYKGIAVDGITNTPLESVSIKFSNTNLGTITNSEGDFNLKIPEERGITSVTFSLLGYETKTVYLTELSTEGNKIRLKVAVTELSQVNISSFKNAEALVRAVFSKKGENNVSEPALMTAFYRETIKKRKRNVSLTEAVVYLYKQPYNTRAKDEIALHKARKSTDYRRLDTVALKLQGGPFSTLYLDIMKYPEYIFTNESISYYDFSFGDPTTINDKPVFVVNFKQKKEITDLRYFGSLFIDSETLALSSAIYSLNLSKNKSAAAKLFVKKKPRDINVTPLKAAYRIDYREKDGQWYYGYGSVQLTFKVNKKRKLFNSVYTLSMEMAVTNWEANTTGKSVNRKDRLKPTVIMSDAVSGFADPDFWGPYNVIEPEKSIESAISKIQRKIRRGQ